MPARTVPLVRLLSPDRARLEAVIALVDVSARVVRLAERTVGGLGLTLPQFDVLSNLALQDGLTQQQLAERLQVTKGNVCGLLDRLEKLGYVRRRPDEHDGRVNRLAITPAGRRRVGMIRPAHDAALVDLARGWDAADAESLQALLARLGPVTHSTDEGNPPCP